MTSEYLAGLLEGEGCFLLDTRKGKAYPRISVEMTDRDVMQGVADRWSRNVQPPAWRRGSTKPVHRVVLQGLPALDEMMSVFPLMGERRRQKIEEILSKWEHNSARDGRRKD